MLYANRSDSVIVEQEWEAMLASIAGGDQAALHALYERSHRPVFTLVMRITRNHHAAEELTVDVFHDVWRRASRYETTPGGSVLGWIMNQARSRAIDRLRYETRKKRTDPRTGSEREAAELDTTADSRELLALEEQGRVLRAALGVLTPDEKSALEAAYFDGLTYAEVAERLAAPLGTIKTRIRSALHKLRSELAGKQVIE